MIQNEIICLGCCIDYQAVARSIKFASHPSRDLIEKIAGSSGRSVPDLRRTCMAHQLSVIGERLEEGTDKEELTQLRSQVEKALDEL
jgi:hypothetical protein